MRTAIRTAGGPRRRPWAARGLVAACAVAGALAAPALAPAAEVVDFGRDILPILSENCFLCHGPDAGTRKAGLRLDRRDGALRTEDPVIVPGKSAESELALRIASTDPEEVMPPPKSGRKLSPAQVELLRRWIDRGAPWGGHWAFEPPRRAEPPAVANGGWTRDPIDRFVLARLEAEKLHPAPEAPRTTLVRRASLALTGLPPTPAEVDAFLADTSPAAYERLVDRLLASPRFGERMATDWLDGARYADTNGYQNDFARTMWPWRDWVITALNRAQPFNDFIVDQVAGDLLPNPTLAQKVATGFSRNNRTVTEAGSIDEEWRIENAVDRVETTSAVFLGLTMGCARCHDHKYDPVTQREFYRFLGFFNSVNEKGVYTEQRGNVPPLVAVPTPEDAKALEALDASIAAAEKAVREQEDSLPERQRRWEAEPSSPGDPAEPKDWSVRCPLDGGLRLEGPPGTPAEALYRTGTPAWADGPSGRALRLDGAEGSYAEAGRPFSPERAGRFSYGAWVRPTGDGPLLSKMERPGGYRGVDLFVSGAKVEVHLIHAWPGDAIKVATREPLPRDAWSHVFVTYDGSGKASGVAVYVDGDSAALDVQADRLAGSIANDEPLRIGSRGAGPALKGELADVRVYGRTLPADEVRAIAAAPALAAARTPERTPLQRELLAREFRRHHAPGLRKATETLAGLRRQRAEREKQVATVMVMEDLPKPRETFVLKRGRYDLPDREQKVEPGVPSCLPPLPDGVPTSRLGLARWLVSPANPLPARVIVNRAWQHHFGVGLVRSAENFGVQGEPPSHPELLDWLADEFVRSGWDHKALHRRIATSATFRQSSTAPAELLRRDPENRLLARGPRFRLSAEAVRDNALAISGLLTEELGGPSVRPYQPAGLWEELAGGAGEGPYVQDKGAKLYRRSLYIYRKRTVPHPALATFDAPSREVCQVRRPRTDTPLQALGLLNDVTYAEAARHLAQLMLAEGGRTADDRIAFAFRRATARAPREAEVRLLGAGLERFRRAYASDSEAAGRLVRQGESPVPAGVNVAELAAYTATASVILNLDETITLE